MGVRGSLSTLRLALASWVLSGLPSIGCTPSVPSFPRFGRDAAIECGQGDGGPGACPAGEVCLQGRCYASCSKMRPCGPREDCVAGVCVAAPGRDGGLPVDGGPPDPCAVLRCAEPTPHCRAGVCLACLESTHCNEVAPVCDVARGTCVGAAPVLCGPCNTDVGCSGVGRCVTRTAASERVCLPTCADDGSCPVGFRCDDATRNCEPLQGTCTGLRAALDGLGCGTGEPVTPDDARCAPVGATPTTGLIVGACFVDGGSDTPTCHHPCSAVDPCPVGRPCDEARGFCR